jgi:hypothetical protein
LKRIGTPSIFLAEEVGTNDRRRHQRPRRSPITGVGGDRHLHVASVKSGRKASSIALRRAASAAIEPASPHPFIPSGLCERGWLPSYSLTGAAKSSVRGSAQSINDPDSNCPTSSRRCAGAVLANQGMGFPPRTAKPTLSKGRVAPKHLPRAPPLTAAFGQGSHGNRPPVRDVPRDRQGKQPQFPGNGDDARGDRLAWRGEPSRRLGDADFALVLAVEATEDVNGRKLFLPPSTAG